MTTPTPEAIYEATNAIRIYAGAHAKEIATAALAAAAPFIAAQAKAEALREAAIDIAKRDIENIELFLRARAATIETEAS